MPDQPRAHDGPGHSQQRRHDVRALLYHALARRAQTQNQELAAAEEEVEVERAARDSAVTATAAASASADTATGEGRAAEGKGKGKTKEDLLEVCAHCGTERSATNPLSRCSRCRLVWYCTDGGCQRAAWPTHKTECRAVEAQAATDPVEELLREHAPSDFKCPIR